jgi:hypothetical protein
VPAPTTPTKPDLVAPQEPVATRTCRFEGDTSPPLDSTEPFADLPRRATTTDPAVRAHAVRMAESCEWFRGEPIDCPAHDEWVERFERFEPDEWAEPDEPGKPDELEVASVSNTLVGMLSDTRAAIRWAGADGLYALEQHPNAPAPVGELIASLAAESDPWTTIRMAEALAAYSGYVPEKRASAIEALFEVRDRCTTACHKLDVAFYGSSAFPSGQANGQLLSNMTHADPQRRHLAALALMPSLIVNTLDDRDVAHMLAWREFEEDPKTREQLDVLARAIDVTRPGASCLYEQLMRDEDPSKELIDSICVARHPWTERVARLKALQQARALSVRAGALECLTRIEANTR